MSKYLVLENDYKLSPDFEDYLKGKDSIILFHADQRDTEEVQEKMRTCAILVFNPTQILFSQYNHMLMAIYDLLTRNVLGVKEIEIYSSNEERLEKELAYVWEGRRKYLDKVLIHVKLYRVDPYTKERTPISF